MHCAKFIGWACIQWMPMALLYCRLLVATTADVLEKWLAAIYCIWEGWEVFCCFLLCTATLGAAVTILHE